MQKKDVVKLFEKARYAGTPLVAIQTSDQSALAERIFAVQYNGSDIPKITWDCSRGLIAHNELGKALLATVDPLPLYLGEVLHAAAKFNPGTLLVLYNAHRFLDEPAVMQGICNLRDPYCEDGSTLVLLGPSFRMTPELTDVVVLDEPLPDDGQIQRILEKLYTQHLGGRFPAEREASSAIDAARGLSAFAAEQIFAMSLTRDGVDLDDTWERKREAVNQTRGLKFQRGGNTFDDLGGLVALKDFVGRYINGPRRPGCVVFMDEIEKALAGATSNGGGGDSSGVSQDFLGAFLTWMEERRHDGIIAVGLPGTGKSAGAVAIGATHGLPTIKLDVGALKGSFVGESENNLRNALKVIDSIAGENGAFVVATCNREASLPPELKRRFRSGTWYVDLPSPEEREAIWKIHLKSSGLDADEERPDDEDWTGAEIRNCCDKAFCLGIPLREAAAYVIPVAKSNQQAVDSLRSAARNWLSASYPGAYRGPSTEPAARARRGRQVKID